jgi:pimeloyl-ACP methyl ester carboxylesterase
MRATPTADETWLSDEGTWLHTDSVDGTRIAWTLSQAASMDPYHRTPVMLCNGIACSDAYWFGVVPELLKTRGVVRWDYRGHGRSDNPVDRAAVGVDACVDDLESVLEAADLPRVVLVGHSFGVQVVLEAAHRFPERFPAVVCIAGSASRPLSRGQDRAAGENVLLALRRFLHNTPRLASRTWDSVWDSSAVGLIARLVGGTTSAVPHEIMNAYFAHVRDRDPQLLLDMMSAMQEHDAEAAVLALTVPLLVLAGDRDRLTPLSVLTEMALAAPKGELAVGHGAAHTLPAERPEWVAREILRFLDDCLPYPGNPV